MNKEGIQWSVRTTLEKRAGDINQCTSPEERLKWLEETPLIEPPIIKEGNLLLNEGMDTMWNLITGQGSETVYSNANARIGVGNGTTAAARTQTALAGASTAFKGMESGFPTAPAENAATDGRCVKFKGSWGDADGNFAWEEWTVDNGDTPNKNMNRKVESLGTKSTGTWTLEVEISLK